MHDDFDDTVLVPSRRVSQRRDEVDEDTVVPDKPTVRVGAPAVADAVASTGESRGAAPSSGTAQPSGPESPTSAEVSAVAEVRTERRPPALVEPTNTGRRRVPLTHKRLTETLRAPSAAREAGVLPPPVAPAPPASSPAAATPAPALRTPPTPSIPAVPATTAHGFRIGDRAPVTLDVPALVGRRPTAPRVPGKVFPRLVRVSSPLNEVSSTHVELRQEGNSVIVTDLRSTNGTIVRMPGSRPVKLRQGDSLVVRPGTQVDIGDGNILEILPPPRLTVPGDSAGERGWS